MCKRVSESPDAGQLLAERGGDQFLLTGIANDLFVAVNECLVPRRQDVIEYVKDRLNCEVQHALDSKAGLSLGEILLVGQALPPRQIEPILPQVSTPRRRLRLRCK